MTEARNFGRKPELTWLPLAKLYVDNTYQRTLESRRSQNLIDKIEMGFTWNRFGAALVSKTDKGYAVLDGQHRIEAARRLKVDKVPVVIIDAGSTAEQAMAFVAANMDRVSVNPFALHHANVAAGEEKAREIARVCRNAGVEIPRYPVLGKNMKPGQTLALAAIATCIKLAGADKATTALKALAEVFKDEVGRLRAPLIKTAVRIVNDGGGTVAFSKALKSIPAADFMLAVSAWVHANGESQEAAHYAVLKDLMAGRKPSTKATRPDVAMDLSRELGTVKLPKPMRRRCQRCNGLFTATKVGELECGCRKRAA